MPHYKYLIVGGGMTADAAVKGIRESDPDGSIGLIGAEQNAPYNRPPLSKGLWKGEALDSIWRGTDKQNVTLHLGRKAQSLDPPKKSVTDDQGNVYTFEKLLLATGATPRRLPFDDGSIIYYRTVEDYRNLRALTELGRRDSFAKAVIERLEKRKVKTERLVDVGAESGTKLIIRGEFIASTKGTPGSES